MENGAVVSSSINKAKLKREKLMKNAQHYKNVLRTWEAAVSKAEGRIPGKNDLKTAPESVQKAYKEFYKLKRYLESSSSSTSRTFSDNAISTSKGPSPSKIFFGRSIGRSPIKSPTSRPSKSKQSGILKPPSSFHLTKNAAGCSFDVFNEKMTFAVNLLGKKSPAKKVVRKEVFDSDAGELVTRKVLIPNRFSNTNTLRSNSLCEDDESSDIGQQSSMEQDQTVVKESSFLDEADHIPPSTETAHVVSKILMNDNESSRTIGKRNSVSAIWHSFSPNPKSKKTNATKRVDSQWLKRCRNVSQMSDDDDQQDDDDDDQQDTNNDFRQNESKRCESDDDDDDKQDCDKREISAASSSQQLFAQSFKNFLMSAEPSPHDDEKEAPILPPATPATNQNTVQPDEEMFDSGLGMSSSFLFSAQEIMDVITNEVLPETSATLPTDKDNIHNENACSPSDNNFQTIDTSLIGNLISANPFASAISSPSSPPRNSDNTENENLRKRKALFSPSPKKLTPKKKFFKSSRIKAKYGIQSYKPPTPSKKKSAATAPKTKSPTTTTKPADKYQEGTIRLSLVSPTSPKKKAEPSSAKSNKIKGSETPTTSLSLQPVTSKRLDKVEYFDEAAQDSYAPVRQTRKRRKLANGGPSLATRIRQSKPNENFVKIDITKKVFVRGHKKISGSKVKRNDWKMKKSASSKEDKLKSLICRKCGESGHFRKFCMKDIIPVEEPQYIDDSPFPSLEEAALMVKTNGGVIPVNHVNIYNNDKDISQEVVESSSTAVLHDTSPTTPSFEEDQPIGHSCGNKAILPYFASEHDLLTQDEEDEILNDTIRKFGYEDFRPRQKEAVSRILKGLSTLCVLSTGSGKSLCYQLPAFLYAQKNPGALAICVSPLVSLMEDQVQGIPPFLQAAFLHSNMPSSQKEKVLEKIRSKKLHILLVSPEAVCGGLFGILRGNDLPQISFACIDEVHCVSQWSHNFRPCYLQLAKILREKLHVRTILGLTATATEHTANSICQTLQIDPSTTIRGEIIPANLHLSASRDTYRDEALLTLLRGERFSACESIIIYCTRRDECQRISALIRTSIQDPTGKNAGVSRINSRQRVSTTCEAYHAGMSAGKRRLVQHQFMSGNIRIVVATVAFGMGIDKSNIRAVIHYNMPKTFESYVQEIGRAGRDGEPAHCHLFLDNVKGRDLSELKRHVYSNSIDRATLRKLLRKIFQSCKCDRIADFSHKGSTSHKKTPKGRCPGHEVSFSIEETVQELDLPQENISTILCYLELDYSRKWIEMLPHTYQTCKIHSYGGAALLKSSALKCPPLAAAIALKKESKKFKDADVYLEFDVIEVSATLGWNSGAVKKELKNLEWTSTSCGADGNTKFRKSGILVEFCNLAFHVNSPGDLTDEEADAVLDYLHNHNQEQEKTQLYQLHKVYQALMGISNNTVENICEKSDEDKSNLLKTFIHTYFLQKTPGVPPEWKNEVTYPEHQEEEIRSNIINLLASVKDAQFTGRSVARIFQGIPSPCFPVEDWARNRSFWRKHIEYDFHYLCKIASQEILRF